jgi:hypothetical protein
MKRTLLAVALLAVTGAASAADAVQAGDILKLMDSYGGNGGGEFTMSAITGTAPSFQTFCLEYNEGVYYGEHLKVNKVNVGAKSGGSGGSVVDGVDGGFIDPISYGTAYLYTKFISQSLTTAYDYTNSSLSRAADASALQLAIWKLEDETANATVLTLYNANSKAQQFVTEATGANWSDIGFVRALNMWSTDGFNSARQDMLYLTPVPEPETYAMLLAGLGLMGFVARRRKQTA